MNRLKPCVFLLIFFFSCTKTPKNIIPEDQMVAVLTDVHLANALASNYADLDTIKQRTSTYLHAVYRRYHIDSAKFNRSLKYYSENPTLLNEMYEQVEKDLKKKEDSIIKLEEIERKRIADAERRKAQLTRDSLIRVRNKGKKDTVISLKPVIPAIWPFKEYSYSIKEASVKVRSIKKK